MRIYRVDSSVEERPDEELSLEEAQEIVGGWIEAITLKRGLLALFDEEGGPALKNLPLNLSATMEVDMLTHANVSHRLYGTVIILRQKDFGYDDD